MAKITGEERLVPEKVQKLYAAVMELLEEGEEISNLRVSTITERAGIGKGTAYEYFNTKEDIVACALFSSMKIAFEGIIADLQAKDNFPERLEVLLDEVEKTGKNRICFFNFIHMMTDRSEFSLLMQEKMDSEAFEGLRPRDFFRSMIEESMEKGEIKSKTPVPYMVFFLFSQLVGYMMAVTSGHSVAGVEIEKLREVVRMQVLKEFEI